MLCMDPAVNIFEQLKGKCPEMAFFRNILDSVLNREENKSALASKEGLQICVQKKDLNIDKESPNRIWGLS